MSACAARGVLLESSLHRGAGRPAVRIRRIRCSGNKAITVRWAKEGARLLGSGVAYAEGLADGL